jgi:hypothetical protein
MVGEMGFTLEDFKTYIAGFAAAAISEGSPDSTGRSCRTDGPVGPSVFASPGTEMSSRLRVVLDVQRGPTAAISGTPGRTATGA